MKADRRRAVHFVAGAWHLVSAFVFLALVASRRGAALPPALRADFEFAVDISAVPGATTAWEVRCYSALTKTTARHVATSASASASECVSTIHAYPIRPASSRLAFRVWVVALPAFAAFWSGVVHLLSSQFDVLRGRNERWVRFLCDYAVTAPAMLSAVNALWGARNVVAVLVYPVVLAVLLAVAPALEDVVVSRAESCCALLALAAMVLFAFGMSSIAPLVEGAALTLPPDAPSGVWVAVAMFGLTFASFLVPYCLSIYRRWHPGGDDDGDDGAEDWVVFVGYIACSMIAKTTLHANVALVAATQLLVEAQPLDVKPRLTMEDAGDAGMASGVIVVVAAVVLWVTLKRPYKWRCPCC